MMLTAYYFLNGWILTETHWNKILFLLNFFLMEVINIQQNNTGSNLNFHGFVGAWKNPAATPGFCLASSPSWRRL